jgi:hypothetical protein
MPGDIVHDQTTEDEEEHSGGLGLLLKKVQ